MATCGVGNCDELGIDGAYPPGSNCNCKPGSAVSTMPGKSGSGACNCLLPSAKVLMADGTSKKMDKLEIGDFIAGFDASYVVPRAQTVMRIVRARMMVVEVLFTGGSIVCSLSHVFMAPDGTQFKAEDIEIGTHQLTDVNGCPIDIIGVTGVPDEIVLGIEVAPDANFVADGVRHHNKAISA